MLKSLEIQGFRCFRELRVEPLTRVNLFVGLNNAGKTSLLEAAELLAIGGVEGLMRSAARRGERVLGRPESTEEFRGHVVDPSHLFFGHSQDLGRSFRIEGDGDAERWVQCKVEYAPAQETLLKALFFQSHVTNEHQRLTISPYGGVLSPPPRLQESNPRVNFLAAESLDASRLDQLWDALVLTPEEEGITQALKLVEPNIERLAFLIEGRGTPSPNILLKLKGSDRLLPLGTLGTGLRHLLALVLNLLSAKGGFLLVDKIDTGLHYSVMVDMWRLVIENAQRLGLQVFATTHSLDCVRALARLRNRYPELGAEVMIHRVERNQTKTVVYDTDDIGVAARGHIEVR